MKKLLLPAIACVIALAACSKDELESTAGKTTAITPSSARAVVNFNYYLTKDEWGQYVCYEPKLDCAKLEPPPYGALLDIDEAIGDNAVQQFFNTEGWEESFPYLEDEPEVVAGLQGGSYTMVRRTTGENVFYIVVTSEAGESFEMSDVIYTTMFDSEL